jgi:4'-phosphopantetheinyl transferase
MPTCSRCTSPGGVHGKPRLYREHPAGEPALAFSMSHAQELMLIAVSACPALGIEVESERTLETWMAWARHVYSGAEHRCLLEMPAAHQRAAFLRYWIRKEACVKALGTGLSTPLEQVQVGCTEASVHPDGWSLTDLQPAPGYAGAAATPGPALRVSHFHFEGCRLLSLHALEHATR